MMRLILKSSVLLAFGVAACGSAALANSYSYGSHTGYGDGYDDSYDSPYDDYDKHTPTYQEVFKGYRCFVKTSGESYAMRAPARSTADWQAPLEAAKSASLNWCVSDGKSADFCQANLGCVREYDSILISNE